MRRLLLSLLLATIVVAGCGKGGIDRPLPRLESQAFCAGHGGVVDLAFGPSRNGEYSVLCRDGRHEHIN